MTTLRETPQLALTPGATVPVDLETTSALLAALRQLHEENEKLRAALAQKQGEPVAWTDADADAARLAMELEALLLSCKDTERLAGLSMNGLANQEKTSGSPCSTCEALARAVMMDQTGKA